MRRLARTAAIAAWVAWTAKAACGQPLMDDGKKLFNQIALPACAVCHTLKHAGAEGAIGPVLDELRPEAARVEKAIRYGLGQMPAYTALTDAQIKLLAEYVAAATRP